MLLQASQMLVNLDKEPLTMPLRVSDSESDLHCHFFVYR